VRGTRLGSSPMSSWLGGVSGGIVFFGVILYFARHWLREWITSATRHDFNIEIESLKGDVQRALHRLDADLAHPHGSCASHSIRGRVPCLADHLASVRDRSQ